MLLPVPLMFAVTEKESRNCLLPAASQGSIPIPAPELLLPAGTGPAVSGSGVSKVPSHKPSSSSDIHAGLQSHKDSWVQLPRQEVAWDIRDFPLAVAASRERMSNPPGKSCGTSALSMLRMAHHAAETFSCMAWLYISSPDVQPSRSCAIPSLWMCLHRGSQTPECIPALQTGMQHWLYPDRLQCLQKSPQDVQSIEAERRQCLGKREH